MEDNWQPEWWESTEKSEHQSHHTAHNSSVAIGDIDEEDADQLREDYDVGHFSTKNQEEYGTVFLAG